MQPKFPTLIEALRSAAGNAPAAKGYTFLAQTGPTHLSFQRLWAEARGQAAALQQQGLKQGDRVLLTWPTSPDFARIYLAIQCCGAVPCVLPAPGRGRDQTGARQRILAIAGQIEARAIIVSDHEVSLFAGAPARCRVWGAEDVKMGQPEDWLPVSQHSDDLAVIQATSGSTGLPKCVALTQRNVLANLEQNGRRLQIDDHDVQVCWLPLYHDMGLIGCFMLVLYWQMQGVFFTPFQFLRQPTRWLQAISDYQGTISPAPNFAFALTTRRAKTAALEKLDLSSWKAAVCGGEPIDVAVLQAFAARFQPCGFDPQALSPAYGLAETALCVSMVGPDEPLHYEAISRTALAEAQMAIPVDEADSAAVTTLCDCGAPVEGTRIQIRDEAGRPLPDGHVGGVWVSGSSLMQSYINLPTETAQQLQAGWLDSGDLGYLRHGRLFVTGRAKELIIIRGYNYTPTDFERAAEAVPGVTTGRVAAVGLPDDETGTEQLVLLCERPRNGQIETASLSRAIQVQVGQQTGIWPAQVVWLPRNAIPRTTSGKLQRHLAKRHLLGLEMRSE